jgi:Fe-S cluster biosynthesis and repair protein YggX
MSSLPADVESRIAQFRNATEQNPADPLGYFSLGRALLEAGRHDDAVLALQRSLALDAKLSRAYQLLARAQLALGRREEAVGSLRQGVLVAHQRGDLMPKNEMIAMLHEQGETPPTFEAPASKVVGEGQVFDQRTQRVGTKLRRPPFKNKLGQVIFDNVSAESWKEAIAHGTKVINELRLPLNDPAAQKVWDQHIVEFLNLREIMDKQG